MNEVNIEGGPSVCVCESMCVHVCARMLERKEKCNLKPVASAAHMAVGKVSI